MLSASSGRDERELASLCVKRGAADAVARNIGPPLPVPARRGASAGRGDGEGSLDERSASAYAVYVFGSRDYDEAAALWASVDLGHSWIKLSGVNATGA